MLFTNVLHMIKVTIKVMTSLSLSQQQSNVAEQAMMHVYICNLVQLWLPCFHMISSASDCTQYVRQALQKQQ